MTTGLTTGNLLLAGALGIVFLMSGACAESGKNEQKDGAEDRAMIERPESMTREERIEMRRKLMEERAIEAAPPQDDESAMSSVVGEVPDELLDKIYADLERQIGADRSDFELLRAEAVEWPDGSLGCGEPGQMYTQALVKGYRIVIGYDDQKYDYRASEQGHFKLCPTFQLNSQQNPNM